MRVALAFWMSLLPIGILFGQAPFSVDHDLTKSRVNSHLDFFIDEDGNDSIEQILGMPGKVPWAMSQGKILRLGTTEAAVWLKLSLRNSTSEGVLAIVLFEDPAIYKIDQFYQVDSGPIVRSHTGTSLHRNDKQIPGNQNALSVFVPADKTRDYYYRVESRNFLSLPVSLYSYKEYYQESSTRHTFQGLYYGGVLIILFFSFVAFVYTEIRTFVYYLISIVFFGLITGIYDGTTPEYWHWLVVLFGGYYETFLSVMSNVFSLLFMASFLELRQYAPGFRRLVILVIGFLLLVLVVSFIWPLLGLNVISLLSIPLMAFVLIGGIVAWRKGNRNARYYVPAYGAMALSVIVAILSLFEVLPLSFLSTYSLHIGYFVSLVILTVGLAQMINQIRMDLKQQEIEKEKAKKRIIEEKNVELRQEVQARTRDISKKEANLRSILDNNYDDNIWLVDREFRFIEFNKRFEDNNKLAFKIEIVRNQSTLDSLPSPEMSKLWKQRCERAFLGETHEYFEEFQMEDTMRFYSIKIYPIRENGQIIGAASFNRDITDLKNAEIELQKRNESLLKLNEELDRFVYSASHDLKAPLASILGLVTITKNEKEEHNRQEYLNLMEKSVTRLSSFIDDIENYSRNARTELSFGRIDLNHTIKTIIEDLYYLQGVDKVKFTTAINNDIEFLSDQSRLNIILSNVLNNALRYTIKYRGAEESVVSITIEVNREWIRISICDNGPGIDAKHHKDIFDMFYRVHESISGTGLGLYIVKETVNKLGGTVTLKSALDQGAEFIIELPNMAPKA